MMIGGNKVQSQVTMPAIAARSLPGAEPLSVWSLHQTSYLAMVLLSSSASVPDQCRALHEVSTAPLRPSNTGSNSVRRWRIIVCDRVSTFGDVAWRMPCSVCCCVRNHLGAMIYVKIERGVVPMSTCQDIEPALVSERNLNVNQSGTTM